MAQKSPIRIWGESQVLVTTGKLYERQLPKFLSQFTIPEHELKSTKLNVAKIEKYSYLMGLIYQNSYKLLRFFFQGLSKIFA